MQLINKDNWPKAISTISKKDVASLNWEKLIGEGFLWEKNVWVLDRLITSSLPRVRDFSGIKATGFDGRGNYNLGVIEQIIFQKLTW
jgi:large subunit ribosomal protein L5